MSNNTTNETNDNSTVLDTNETADGNLSAIIESVEESGLLDRLMDEPLLVGLVAVVLGLGAYIAYTVPAVKALVFNLLSLTNSFIIAGIPPALKKPSIRCSPAGWQFANNGIL